LPWLDAQMLTRFDVQLSPDPLLPLEQYAIGGRYTVRGYRENTLVRDQGFNASVELRIPIFERIQPAILIELAPFADVGRSWNNSREGSFANTRPETLASVGVGVRTLLLRRVFGELYWGHLLKHIRDLGDSDLQDDGIHFRLGLTWP
jgi:hemolysin activation/secretion protein